MSHERILSCFKTAVKQVAGRIQSFVYKPGHDFTREGKLPAEKLLSFLVSQGSSSTKNELNQAFSFSETRPSESAFVQKRAKLKPEAFEEVFHHFKARSAVQSLQTYTCTTYWSAGSRKGFNRKRADSVGWWYMRMTSWYASSTKTRRWHFLQAVGR